MVYYYFLNQRVCFGLKTRENIINAAAFLIYSALPFLNHFILGDVSEIIRSLTSESNLWINELQNWNYFYTGF